MFSSVVGYLVAGLAVTVQQLGLLLGPALILAFLMHGLSGFLRANAARVFGHGLYIYATAPGTILHELGHAVFCIVFGHRITDLRLFAPSSDGTLGYVNHAYDPGSTYQQIGNFFIGTGPIWFGSAAIVLLSRFLLGPAVFAPMSRVVVDPAVFASWSGFAAFAESLGPPVLEVFRNLLDPALLTSWRFYLFAYLVFCIGGHVTLSPSDIRGAASGFGFLVLFLIVANWSTLWLGDPASGICRTLAGWSVGFYAVMLFAALLSLAVSGVLLLLGGAGRLVGARMNSRLR